MNSHRQRERCLATSATSPIYPSRKAGSRIKGRIPNCSMLSRQTALLIARVLKERQQLAEDGRGHPADR